MKLLIITHLVPYPLTDGGRVSQYALIDYLRNKCSITLLLFAYSEVDHTAIATLKKKWENVAFEAIDMFTPTPAKKRRTVKSVLKAGSRALLYKATIAHEQFFSTDSNPVENIINTKFDKLRQLADFGKPRDKKIIDQVIAVVEKIKPDLVQIEFVYLLDLALCIPKNVKKLFIHHELRFKRIETEAMAAGYGMETYADYLVKFCEATELSLLSHFDAIFTLSENDKHILRQRLPDKQIFSSPFPILDDEIVPIKRENLSPRKLVFVGAEFHTPNKDAIEWYIQSMADILYKKLGFVLHVVGHWSEETKEMYKENKAVHFAGFVESLETYCRNSIMVVPLRIGSGIRAKILYAAANGIPIVSTFIGSEGIVEYDKMGLTANTPVEFEEAISKIVNDLNFAEMLVARAQETLKKNYSQQVAGEKRFELYKLV